MILYLSNQLKFIHSQVFSWMSKYNLMIYINYQAIAKCFHYKHINGLMKNSIIDFN